MSFTVYKSSAGSGKTYTLVREYLRLVLPDPSLFRNVLAITFTNKAANEMKERVLEGLKGLSSVKTPASSLMKQLSSETGMSEEMISAKASQALELILHRYSDFAIGTIDSFSHRIVRTFARDFGLPVNFTVSLESDELRRTAIDLLLNKAGEDKHLTDLLVKFLETMTDEDKGWNIEDILFRFSAILEDEESLSHLEKLKTLTLEDFGKISGKLAAHCKALESRLMSPGIEAIRLIEQNGIAPESFYYNSSGFYGYMARIAKGNFTNLEVKRYLRETLEEEKWTSKTALPSEKEKIAAISGQLLNFYEQFRLLYDTSFPHFVLLGLLRKTIYPLGVLNMIGNLLTEFKKQNSIVQIGEFNRHISKVIMNEPVPFIYERLGERFKHILIDEFQDTSKIQWGNLLPLIENSLGSGYFNLIVGDGKQAIYRWRNGDVGQFVSLPVLSGSNTNSMLKIRQNLLEDHYHEESLKTNYRSRKNIIEFNNGFFSFLSDNFLNGENKKVYQEVEQDSSLAPEGGFVSLELLEGENASVYSENNLNRILEIVRDLESRNFQWKDIAILCRANNKAGEIARFLMMNGIKVISAESLLLNFSAEVRFLVNFIQLLSMPDDPHVRAEIILYLHQRGDINTEIHEILRKTSSAKSFYGLLKETGFEINIRKISMLPLYDICEELIRTFSLNRTPDPYIQFFLDAIIKFSKNNSSGISGFPEWWEQENRNISVVVPEGINAVHIMTIHKAKGLQFPVVIYPFANERKKYSRNFVWLDLNGTESEGLPAAMVRPEKRLADTVFKDVLEEEDIKSELDLLNLIYVAMTRPVGMLYVLSHTPPKENGAMCVPALLQKYIQAIGQWEEGTSVYTFGDPLFKEDSAGEDAKDANTDTVLRQFISGNWRKQIRIRSRAPLKWDMDDPLKNRTKGNLIHTILSKIKTKKDSDQALYDAVTSGLVPPEEETEIRDLILKIINDEAVAPFFADDLNVINEAEILQKDGQVARPDRVIIGKQLVAVMDYKTGKPGEDHEKQLRQYQSLLLELGYADVKKYLLYLDPEIKLVEIS